MSSRDLALVTRCDICGVGVALAGLTARLRSAPAR